MEKRGVVPVPVLKRKCLEHTERHTGLRFIRVSRPLVAELGDVDPAAILDI